MSSSETLLLRSTFDSGKNTIQRRERINISHILLLLTTEENHQEREMENKYIFLVVKSNSPKANNKNNTLQRKSITFQSTLLSGRFTFIAFSGEHHHIFPHTKAHQSHLIQQNPLPICYITIYKPPLPLVIKLIFVSMEWHCGCDYGGSIGGAL